MPIPPSPIASSSDPQQAMRLFLVGEGASAIADDLRGAGYVVCGVAGPDEAAAQIAATRPDLVLLDLAGDGAALARDLRRQLDLPVVSIIADGGRPAQAAAAEPFAVVAAAGDGPALEVALQAALAQHRLERRLREAEERAAQAEAREARLAFLIANSPAVIFTCEAGGEFREIYMSPNVGALFGYAPENFVNDPGFWERHVH